MLKSYKSKIIISDYIIYCFINNVYLMFQIPPGLIVNGEIIDINHLFYLFNKFLKENRVRNNISTDVIIVTSNFEFKRINETKIEKADLSSYIYYYLKIEKENFEDILYTYKAYNYLDRSIIDIFIIEKFILDNYIKLFNNLKLNINTFNVLNSLVSENILIFNESHSIIIKNNIINCTRFNKEMSKFLIENKIYLSDFSGLVKENIYDTLVDNEIISEKLTKFLLLQDKLNKYYKEKYEIEMSVKLEDYINNLKNYKINKSFTNINKKSSKLKYIMIIIMLFICINLFVNYSLNKEIEMSTNNLNIINREYANEKDKITKLNENNRICTKDNNEVSEILNYFLNNNIDFQEYRYVNDKISIKCIIKDQEILKGIEDKLNKDIIVIEDNEDKNFKIIEMEINK